jgi:hypothetical protein
MQFSLKQLTACDKFLFEKCAAVGVSPHQKNGSAALFKRGSQSDPSNYRPISSLFTLGKVCEKLVPRHRHGFRPQHSTTTAIAAAISKITKG